MQTDIPKNALSIAEVMQATSLGRTMIYKQMKENRLKFFKVGRRTLVLAEEMQAWLRRLALESQGD
jgi:excisionase family DNA binding protein